MGQIRWSEVNGDPAVCRWSFLISAHSPHLIHGLCRHCLPLRKTRTRTAFALVRLSSDLESLENRRCLNS